MHHGTQYPRMHYGTPSPRMHHMTQYPRIHHGTPSPRMHHTTQYPTMPLAIPSHPGRCYPRMHHGTPIISHSAPQDSVPQNAPLDSISHNAPRDSISHNAPQDSISQNAPRPPVAPRALFTRRPLSTRPRAQWPRPAVGSAPRGPAPRCRPAAMAARAVRSGLAAGRPLRLGAALAVLTAVSLSLSVSAEPPPGAALLEAAGPSWGWRNLTCPGCRLLFGALDLALQVRDRRDGTEGVGKDGRARDRERGREGKGTGPRRRTGMGSARLGRGWGGSRDGTAGTGRVVTCVGSRDGAGGDVEGDGAGCEGGREVIKGNGERRT